MALTQLFVAPAEIGNDIMLPYCRIFAAADDDDDDDDDD